MEVAVSPINKLDAELECPKSRSCTNRALLIAALAEGRTTLKNCLECDDVAHMKLALQQMGVHISGRNSMMNVTGTGGRLSKPGKKIFTGNSGTTMRFMAAAATLAGGSVVIDGDKRMRKRPIGDLAESLNQLGAEVTAKNGYPPVIVSGRLKGGNASINGALSSQFTSAILMVSPFAERDVEVRVIGEMTSKPYIDMTVDMMGAFGVAARNSGYKRFTVGSGQLYRGREYLVEGDYSNASYFFAAAAVTKGRVRVTGLNPKSRQADAGFLSALGKMGCYVKRGDGWVEVRGNELNGIDIDMNSMPDAAQTLAVVAAFAKGKTTIRNIRNLRIKETDRIRATAIELRKIGADVDELADGWVIAPSSLKSADIETYNDHRMAMSFAIAGLACRGIRIRGAECVSKTFPDFFEVLGKLRS